jgi:hypothetical protein
MSAEAVGTTEAGADEDVLVPAKVSRYHPVVKEFRERSERHEVSRAALPRVLRILQGLTVEAERRGYEVALAQPTGDPESRRGAWSGGRHGHILITVRGHAAALRVSEEGLQSRTYWEDKNRTYSRTHGEYRSPPLSEYEANGTGRIGIEPATGYGMSRSSLKWADRRSGTLEEKLPLLLRDLERRAAASEHRQREVECRAIERERQWQAAVDRARERHVEHHRGELLRGEAARWREAEQIRAYCDAAEAAYPDDRSTAAWVAWGRRHADQLDPLHTAPQMPSAPAPESVPPEELRPFLEGWSPHGPDGRMR